MPDTGDSKENNLWFIVRYMKGCCVEDPDLVNKFTLKGGETLKVGRNIIKVVEVSCGKYKFSQKNLEEKKKTQDHLNETDYQEESFESFGAFRQLIEG